MSIFGSIIKGVTGVVKLGVSVATGGAIGGAKPTSTNTTVYQTNPQADQQNRDLLASIQRVADTVANTAAALRTPATPPPVPIAAAPAQTVAAAPVVPQWVMFAGLGLLAVVVVMSAMKSK